MANGSCVCQKGSLRCCQVSRFSKVAVCHVMMTSGMTMFPVLISLTFTTAPGTRNQSRNKLTLTSISVLSIHSDARTSPKAKSTVYGVTIWMRSDQVATVNYQERIGSKTWELTQQISIGTPGERQWDTNALLQNRS